MNLTFKVNRDKTVDIVGKQGTTWQFELVLAQPGTQQTPFDLTGYSARGQIRKDYKSPTVVRSFQFSIPNPTNGRLLVSLSASDTAQIPAGKSASDSESTYVYDIELYTPGDGFVTRILQGKLFIDPEVTK